MLTWDEEILKDKSGKVIGESYTAQLPHWGKASIHPRTNCLGEMFLDCFGLGIEMHSLGQATGKDTLNPAEAVLLRALKQQAVWCLEAMVAIGNPEN